MFSHALLSHGENICNGGGIKYCVLTKSQYSSVDVKYRGGNISKSTRKEFENI
jgi:hypothetical protein